MLRRRLTVLGIAIALSASGCGEQTPVVPPATSAEGLWIGTTSTNRTLTAAVLDDGTSYFFYSVSANPNQIAGVLQGLGVSDKGNFTSTNTKDFGIGTAASNTTISRAAFSTSTRAARRSTRPVPRRARCASSAASWI